MPNWQEFLLLVTIGVLGGLGQILLVQAYRYGDASLVAPFEYSTMIWATALGWFFFGEWPAAAVITGSLIVIASGIYVILREKQLGLLKRETREVGPSRST
jgi:drug/metabolite transporter (DMT)-like permease